MRIRMKWRNMEDPTKPIYHLADNFSDVWTLIRSAVESGFDYIELEVLEK